MSILALVVLGVVAGTLGSLLGLGGGFLVVPALLLGWAFDPVRATGTAIAVIVPSSLIALWRRGMAGHVDWKVGALIAVGAVAGAFVGSWLAGRVDPTWLRRGFAICLILVAVRLLWTP